MRTCMQRRLTCISIPHVSQTCEAALIFWYFSKSVLSLLRQRLFDNLKVLNFASDKPGDVSLACIAHGVNLKSENSELFDLNQITAVQHMADCALLKITKIQNTKQ